ncbi:hypothetical protein BC332_30922 [Capsicum chinense]|nr:hypothetical protein BC332_30922 [Capsicum chinense]
MKPTSDTSQMATLIFEDMIGGHHLKAQDLVTTRAQEYARKTRFEHKQGRVWKIAWSIEDLRTHGFGQHLMGHDLVIFIKDYPFVACSDQSRAEDAIFSYITILPHLVNVWKCQDCKAKYDGVINVINSLTSSIKEMTSKRGVIPSKRISYLDTPLEIKAVKRRKKDTSKASSSIKKDEPYVAIDGSSVQYYCTALIYLFEVVPIDNPSDTTEDSFIATDGQSIVYLYFALTIFAFQVDVTVEATTEKHNITVDNLSTTSKEEEKVEPPEVFRNEECLINIIKDFSIPISLPWHLVDGVYTPINCSDEFHWVLAAVVLKERHIRVYESMSRRRHFRPLSEIQKLAKILPTYLDMCGFLDQNIRIDWSMIEAYQDKMANPFDVQYVEGISQQTVGSL